MAIQGPLPVEFGAVFPRGAFAVSVEAQRDFDKSSREHFVQATTDEGLPVWTVTVIDGDTSARQTSVKVKIAATQQPVLPDSVPGVPFHPVELDGLHVRPYVDRNSGRLAYAFTATGVRSPQASPAATARAAANGSTGSTGSASSSGKDGSGSSGSTGSKDA